LTKDIRTRVNDKDWEKGELVGKSINGKKNGEWTSYYKNGQLERIEIYSNDTLNGKQIIYRPDGKIKISRHYLNGIEFDTTKFYHSNGQVNFVEFRDSLGRKQGVLRVYYSNGQPSQIAYFKDGKFDSISSTYFENGKIKEIENYKFGEKTGTWIKFSENGDTIRIDKY
jgi:antitoxin component YwqK of YwqJK toxin-antitoxin module